MFWGDKIADDVQECLKDRIAQGALVIRDEKTASGHVHVGAMRGVALHGVLSRILSARGVENTFLYEINDMDAFDSVPKGVPEAFHEHLGKPLYAVPSPEGGAGNFAQFFGTEFARTIEASGFYPQFYYSSEEYRAGKYNDAIRVAIEKAPLIRKIYKEVSEGVRDDLWVPLMVICEACGKIATTRVTHFDGEKVTYVCDLEAPGSGVSGCGYGGEVSPFDGQAKLHWKVEWAAKFMVFGVDIEGEGKDLATKGGARNVADRISKEVFGYTPPYDVPYEFLLVGGKKMATSKGNAATAAEVAAAVPPKIFRTFLLGKDIKKAINFETAGDTIPVLYDQYDKLAQKYWSGTEDDDARLFSLIHGGDAPEAHFLPRFSQVAFLVQMPHLNLSEEAEKMKGAALSDLDISELKERALYARQWLTQYAPEAFRYELQHDAVPEAAQALPADVKAALRDVATYITEHEELDGATLHEKLHEIKKRSGVLPAAFFQAIYQSFLGRDSGPQAGWFLSVLPREFLLGRLEEVSQ